MNNRLIEYGRIIIPVLLHLAFFQYVILANGWWFLGFHLLGMLLIPLQRSPLFILLLCGMVGALVDLAAYEGGLFMSSGLIMGLAIPVINRLMAPREGYENSDEPTIASMGLAWFIIRTATLLLIHHLWLFTWEASRWGLVFSAWGKAFTSSLFSTLAFALIVLLTQRQTKGR
ncbi:MAG: hypothetical protein O2818_01335 [Bacteroidetes bacterium]|nr:hypothetical protein [Bacteroidota bacterium]